MFYNAKFPNFSLLIKTTKSLARMYSIVQFQIINDTNRYDWCIQSTLDVVFSGIGILCHCVIIQVILFMINSPPTQIGVGHQ